MTNSALPFDDIRNLVADLPEGGKQSRVQAAARNRQLVKPEGGLGRLEEIALWLAQWQGRERPSVDRPFAVIFTASHGFEDRRFPLYTAGHARQMMETYAAGGGASNQIAATSGIGLKVFELALDIPTEDTRVAAALDERSAAATFAFGMEAIAGEPDLLSLGDLGGGSSIVASAICCALYGGDPGDWCEHDSAIPDAHEQWPHDIVRRTLDHHANHLRDPLEIMRRVGGRETCAIAGAIIASRLQGIPVVLDGFSVCAAAALLQALNPRALDHCVAGHVSPGHPHRNVLQKLSKRPLLDLDIALAEGAGATLAAGIIKAAAATHNDMATRAQAGVTGFGE